MKIRRRPTIRSFIPAAVALLALAAVQAKAATLDESKPITAGIEGSSFIPPPRSINDITRILDEQTRDNADAVEAGETGGRRPPASRPLFSPGQDRPGRAPLGPPPGIEGLGLRAAPRTTGMDSAELARLPDTADEIKSIAAALNAEAAGSVFLGRQANEDRIKSMDLSGYKVLAFASHGLVPGDLDGLVQPALAFSSPKVTGGKNDGFLT